MTQNTAALYCRLSRRPDDDKLMGIAEQERALRAVARERGLEVVGTYVDSGVSAFKKTKRPGFLDLVAAIERGEVGYVLVVAIDRAARRMADLALILEAAEEAGTLIVADGKEYHPGDDALQLYILGAVAAQESRDKVRRVIGAKAVALELGRFNGGRRTFGYDYDRDVNDKPIRGKGLHVVPKEAKAIRAGAATILAGGSLADVAKAWNEAGFSRPVSKSPWTVAKVRRALLSPIVAGLRTHNGQTVTKLTRPDGSEWPIILAPERQAEVERKLRARYGHDTGKWHTKNPGLLSGIVTCAVCNNNLTPRRHAKSTAYTCQSDGGSRCGTVGISMGKLDDLITDSFLYRADSAKFRRALAKPRRSKVRAPDLDPTEVQRELDELAEMVGNGTLTVREFQIARKPLAERLERALATLDAEEDASVLTPFSVASDVQTVWDGLDFEMQRAVLRRALDRVTVAKSAVRGGQFDADRVDAVWRF